jgi:hypothetical protein
MWCAASTYLSAPYAAASSEWPLPLTPAASQPCLPPRASRAHTFKHLHHAVHCCVIGECSRQFGHRVKGVSMSTFKTEEVTTLEESGNAVRSLAAHLVQILPFSRWQHGSHADAGFRLQHHTPLAAHSRAIALLCRRSLPPSSSTSGAPQHCPSRWTEMCAASIHGSQQCTKTGGFMANPRADGLQAPAARCRRQTAARVRYVHGCECSVAA